MAKRQEAKPSASASSELAKEAAAKDLPVAETPKLDGTDGAAAAAVAVNELTSELAARLRLPAARRTLRFALLGGSVALAAALGSLSASGLAHLWSGGGANAGIAETNAQQTLQAVQAGVEQIGAIKTELAEVSALKASLDGAARSANSQFAKLADRLERLERAQADPTSRIGHIAETVDRLEKRGMAAGETTGSVASNEAAASPEATLPDKVLPDKVLPDWVVQDVRRGRALVASRYGGVFAVGTGSVLPGLGRVETIKRQDGQWIVVTEHGLIAER